MKLFPGFIALLSMAVVGLVSAEDRQGPNRFQSFVSVIGPVNVHPEQTLKLCSTDVSLYTRPEAGKAEKSWSEHYPNGRGNTGRVVWSSTRVDVFDSTDTLRALPVVTSDLIFPTGKGSCLDVAGHEVSRDGIPRTVVIVLTTLTEAQASFDPVASGQLIDPNTTSAIGLLVPAVIKIPEPLPDNCCACAPVCGCGIC